MIDKDTAKEALFRFLSLPLTTARPVLAEFAALPGALSLSVGEHCNFVYVPGTREDRVLLVAHADTVWDGADEDTAWQRVYLEGGVIRGENRACGIGADDRAGCALLWLMRESGHSLLILDGEELGRISAEYIKEAQPDLFRELNEHAYILELDRRQHENYKVYRLPVSREFLSFIEEGTGYRLADNRSSTDIVTLCHTVCGANLSVGYYDEHSEDERLVFSEWYHTLGVLSRLTAPPQRRFPLTETNG